MASVNFATEVHGARVIDQSSEVAGGLASSVLDANPDTAWFADTKLNDRDDGGKTRTHWLCVSLRGCKSDTTIRTVGWHCAQAYSTNPREVFLHVSTDGITFKAWDRFVAMRPSKGTHLFCLSAPISTAIYPFVVVEVTQTFATARKGGEEDEENMGDIAGETNGGTARRCTYMNRLFLYSEEVPMSPLASLGPRRGALQPRTAAAAGAGAGRDTNALPMPVASPGPVSLSNHSSFLSPTPAASSSTPAPAGAAAAAASAGASLPRPSFALRGAACAVSAEDMSASVSALHAALGLDDLDGDVPAEVEAGGEGDDARRGGEGEADASYEQDSLGAGDDSSPPDAAADTTTTAAVDEADAPTPSPSPPPTPSPSPSPPPHPDQSSSPGTRVDTTGVDPPVAVDPATPVDGETSSASEDSAGSEGGGAEPDDPNAALRDRVAALEAQLQDLRAALAAAPPVPAPVPAPAEVAASPACKPAVGTQAVASDAEEAAPPLALVVDTDALRNNNEEVGRGGGACDDDDEQVTVLALLLARKLRLRMLKRAQLACLTDHTHA